MSVCGNFIEVSVCLWEQYKNMSVCINSPVEPAYLLDNSGSVCLWKLNGSTHLSVGTVSVYMSVGMLR